MSMKKHVKIMLVLSLLFLTCCSDELSQPIEKTDAATPVVSNKQANAPISRVQHYHNWIGNVENVSVAIDSEDLLAKNYYLVFDASDSMADYISQAQNAVIDFVKILPDGVNLGLLVFNNSGCCERISIKRLNEKSRKVFVEYISQIPADGGTPLSDAIELSKRALTAQAKKQLGYGEYNLIVITDGDANPGFDPTNVVRYINDNTLIIVRTIGFRIGTDHVLNQPGETYYSTAGDQQSLLKALQETLSESPSFDTGKFE